MTAPTIGRHHHTDCDCREQVQYTLADLAGIHDGYLGDEEAPEPEPVAAVRTETACNYSRCECLEFPGFVLIDGWRHCKTCGHTDHLHRAAGKITRKARR